MGQGMWRSQYEVSKHSQDLLTAVRAGEAFLVDKLLRGLAVPDCCDAAGVTPLHAACDAGRADIVEMLLRHGASVEAPGGALFDGPPGPLAAKRGHAECLRHLLMARAAPETPACAELLTGVHLAAAEGHVACLRLLFGAHKPTARVAERGAVEETIYRLDDLVCNIADSSGRLPLHAAAAAGHTSCLEALIREGFSLLDEVDDEGDGAIHIATLAQDEGVAIHMCRLLAEGRADVNLATACDDTALHLAAGRGSARLCAELLGNAADANAVEAVTGRTPLHLAARGEHVDVCQELLQARADAHSADHESHGTAWTYAHSPPCRELLFKAMLGAERHCYEVGEERT